MASVGHGVEGKRPHIKTSRMQEFLKTQGDSNHKIRSCPFDGCQKTFTSSPGLRYHVQTHSISDKPFQCSKCKKSFKSSNGLRYHKSKTRCEEFTDNQLEKQHKSASTDLVLPETGGNMEKLHQLADIATGPQSPLLQSGSPSWERPRYSVESDMRVTSSFPFPSSPKDFDVGNMAWSHPLSTAVWQCFMRGSFIKVLSWPDCDWQTAEELAEQRNLSSVNTDSSNSAEHSIGHILRKPAPFVLDRMECDSDGKSVDLYFTVTAGKEKFFHILAQCPQNHPFFVKNKGWSSCCPHQTEKLYGISSRKLEKHDICLSPFHPDVSFTNVYEKSDNTNGVQLNSQDSSAASTLCSMAQHKRQCQEHFSPPMGQQTEADTTKKAKQTKRPMNAFMLFAKQYRLEYTKKFPGRDNREISVMLGEEWKRLDLKKKEFFQKEAEKLALKTIQTSPDCWKRKK